MDLLDSIMSKMDTPPVINDKQKKLIKEHQKAVEEAKNKEKEILKHFRKTIEERINSFIQDSKENKKRFEPMERVARSIVRDVADIAGLTTYVFGLEEEERHVMVFKKEYPLSEEEVSAYRNDLEYDPVKTKEEALQKEILERADNERANKLRKEKGSNKFLEKYERLVGKESGLEAAKVLELENKQFGFVKSELKTDKRTIEETLADIKAKKMRKAAQESETSSDPLT